MVLLEWREMALEANTAAPEKDEGAQKCKTKMVPCSSKI